MALTTAPRARIDTGFSHHPFNTSEHNTGYIGCPFRDAGCAGRRDASPGVQREVRGADSQSLTRGYTETGAIKIRNRTAAQMTSRT